MKNITSNSRTSSSLAAQISIMTFKLDCAKSPRATHGFSHKVLKLIALTLSGLFSITALGQSTKLPDLHLPPGFSIEPLNFSVPNARQIVLTDSGTLIVGTRNKGKVYAIANALSAPKPNVVTLFDDLTMPSGVAMRDGDLYIGATNKIIKVANVDQHLKTDPPHSIITDQLPSERHHGWKYLKFGADGKLYVPVGAPCNICLSEDPRFASILTMDVESGATSVYAHGVRNTVGFDWHPQSGALWFGDNGRDMMGDDIPPEEVNVATKPGQHFGYPFVHAGDIDDPEFGDRPHPAAFVAPTVNFQAHSAPLGMTFYQGEQFPKAYENVLFMTEHGSWNRSARVGYQVSTISPDPSSPGKYVHKPFITGWLVGEKVKGRPNDVVVTPNGSLLIADDKQGIIYRVSYSAKN